MLIMLQVVIGLHIEIHNQLQLKWILTFTELRPIYEQDQTDDELQWKTA